VSATDTDNSIRVLIIDDDEGHAEALADGLETEDALMPSSPTSSCTTWTASRS